LCRKSENWPLSGGFLIRDDTDNTLTK
jgi:hypothetical protein